MAESDAQKKTLKSAGKQSREPYSAKGKRHKMDAKPTKEQAHIPNEFPVEKKTPFHKYVNKSKVKENITAESTHGSNPVKCSNIGQLLEDIKSLDSLQLDACGSVENYTRAFCRLDRKISSSSQQVLPEPVLIAKFLYGLGFAYKDFQNRFMLSYSLHDSQNSQSVTLADAVWEALNAQGAIRGDSYLLLGPSDELLARERLVMEIMGKRFELGTGCEHCQSKTHTGSRCSKRYTYLKRSQHVFQDKDRMEGRTSSEALRAIHEANNEAAVAYPKALKGVPKLHIPSNIVVETNQLDPTLLSAWIIHNSASHHLCWDPTQFNIIEPYVPPGESSSHLEAGSGKLYKIEGHGTVDLFRIVENQLKLILLTGVLFCPGLPTNFLSLKNNAFQGCAIGRESRNCDEVIIRKYRNYGVGDGEVIVIGTTLKEGLVAVNLWKGARTLPKSIMRL